MKSSQRPPDPHATALGPTPQTSSPRTDPAAIERDDGFNWPALLKHQWGEIDSHAISSREACLAQLVENAALGIVCCDSFGSIELFNRAAEILFETTAVEAAGQNWQQFLLSHCCDESREAIEATLAANCGPTAELWTPIMIIRSDGWLLPGELNCINVALDNLNYLCCFVRNVDDQTRRFRDKQSRLSALAEKGRITLMAEMASGIAHEINQPLTAIAAYLQSTLRLLRSKPEQRIELVKAALGKALEQTDRAANTVKRLSQPVGFTDVVSRSCDINVLIRSTLGFVADDLHGDGIEVDLDLMADLPRAYCDAVNIEHVMLNLLRNSHQAIRRSGHARGTIAITTRVRDLAFIEVFIHDSSEKNAPVDHSGPGHHGLSARELSRDIGLRVSIAIIEANGGRFWVDPEGMDHGGGIHFTLRIARTGRPNEAH